MISEVLDTRGTYTPYHRRYRTISTLISEVLDIIAFFHDFYMMVVQERLGKCVFVILSMISYKNGDIIYDIMDFHDIKVMQERRRL
jgi:hypothetical protein